MAPRLAVWGLLLGAGVGVSACGGKGAVAMRPCTLEARASVSVQVVDTKGQAQPDARVRFTLDGGAEQQAPCNGGGEGDCASWVTNYETAGAYVVTATSADGQRSAQERVTVGRDECHVQGQTLTLVLPD
ncbi:hypothetical protein [Archangium primigenium]|uniref:hypothetical protein n=1 Tax=[Archangium] primigenium TaxID=2792470 RepID=UPI00195C0EBA|nr:hypothetical protein [Archangium primigenium]MBM7112571.1 hypothetical protein [Archangium primigenium]